MGMQWDKGRGNAEPEVLMDINTTPLIDVMLVLLIMLIITIPAQLHSVNLDTPQASASRPAEPVVVRVEVGADNTIVWNGKVLEGAAELQSRLQEAARTQPQPELHLRAHARARYETVAAVLAGAQRSGLTRLGVLDTQQFAD